MKKIVLTTVILGTGLLTAGADAQLGVARPTSINRDSSAMEGLKDARKQMEANTESQILEKLEASRLQDEKNRRQRFETLNFNVVADPTSP